MKKRYVPLFEEYSQDEENNGVITYIDFDKQNERSRELNKPKGNIENNEDDGDRVIDTDMGEILKDCMIYIMSEEDKSSKQAYLDELAGVNTIEDIVQTGIFHDAIGKFIGFGDDDKSIIISTDY